MEFIVIVEGPEDARTACQLADRVIAEEGPHWLDPHTRDAMRIWTGLPSGTDDFTRWREVKELAQSRGVRNIGFPKSGQPGGANLAQARKAIQLHALMRGDDNAPALLLVRDTDADRDSRRDFEEARRQPETPGWLTVVVGVAAPKREAWVLHGFDPEDADEEERLETLQEELGRDPRTESHALNASATGAQNNAKRVLGELVRSDKREQQCWTATDLSVLRKRGRETGLTAYLEEVEERLLPLFRSRPE